jgi:hypothetical protein
MVEVVEVVSLLKGEASISDFPPSYSTVTSVLGFLFPILVHQPDSYIEKLRIDANLQNKFVAAINDIFNPPIVN